MIMRLKRRAFVDKLDFLTSPGHLTGGDSRARLGLPGGGPELVITDKAILTFDNPRARNAVKRALSWGYS